MSPPSRSSSETLSGDAVNDLDLGIKFVHVANNHVRRPASCTAVARSHVMKRFHQRKQLDLAQRQENFRNVTAEQMQGKRAKRSLNREEDKPLRITGSVAAGVLDPFDAFAADLSELPSLLAHPLARQAGEPVVNFNCKTGYQGLHTVFRSGLEDPALVNAILMTLTFAIDGDASGEKFLKYRGEALRWINVRMQDFKHAATAATIGAILLMVGVEARMKAPKNVESHMKGVKLLLQLCESQQAYLPDGIKRAIFWQDLLSAVLTGSTRLADHETFAELTWRRDPFQQSAYYAPLGFQAHAAVLGDEFLSIIEDIKALQVARDSIDVDHRDAITIMHLNNQQASIESRLYESGRDPVRFTNPVLYNCNLASYLCTYMLFNEVWDAGFIPQFFSSYLLERLQYPEMDIAFAERWDLFVWIICVVGTCTRSAEEQTEYAIILKGHTEAYAPELSEAGVLQLLRGFVWSVKISRQRWGVFWERVERFSRVR